MCHMRAFSVIVLNISFSEIWNAIGASRSTQLSKKHRAFSEVWNGIGASDFTQLSKNQRTEEDRVLWCQN